MSIGKHVAAKDVSVIIAAWNAEDTITRATESALGQVGVEVEVVVVDDASSDATLSTLNVLKNKHPGLVVLAQPQNGGPAAARNAAIRVSSGRFITPLDADDYMEADRCAKLIEIADQGSWDLVADDMFIVRNGQETERLLSSHKVPDGPLTLEAFVVGNLPRPNSSRHELGFLKPLISRDFMTKFDLWYDESMRLGEDFRLYCECLLRGAQFCLTGPAGYHAVVRSTSLSGQHGASELGAMVAADLSLLGDSQLDTPGRQALLRHLREVQKKWHWLRLIDAVKARDIQQAARAFVAPPQVGGYLLSNLAEQMVRRSRRRFFGVIDG